MRPVSSNYALTNDCLLLSNVSATNNYWIGNQVIADFVNDILRTESGCVKYVLQRVSTGCSSNRGTIKETAILRGKLSGKCGTEFVRRTLFVFE